MESDDEPLARFGHHPDPANDFCIEVEGIEGDHHNRTIGFGDVTREGLLDRIALAMQFTVGGDAATYPHPAFKANVASTA